MVRPLYRMGGRMVRTMMVMRVVTWVRLSKVTRVNLRMVTSAIQMMYWTTN
jgi:hypothetical protein